MARTQKVTVTLPVESVTAVRHLVEAGAVASVSAFVQHAVAVALDDVAGWGTALEQALVETGGGLTSDERAWADDVLGNTGARRLTADAGAV